MSSLREELRSKPVLASFIGIGHPAAVEVMAWRGFGVLCIDAEHAALGPAEVEDLVRAAAAAGARALVRVPGIGTSIAHALDAGAAGVVVPRIGSAAEARRCVELVRYPPDGVRGAGIGRASGYGLDLAGQLERANSEVLLVVQIETREGVGAAAEVARVEGVDVIFVGPGDLAVSLGCEIGSPEHTRAIETVIAAALDADTIVGIFCAQPQQVGEWLRRGVRLLVVGSDLGLLGASAEEAARLAGHALESDSATAGA